ncbi:MAG TPA: SPFH domain-containing protein [Polyangiaceae bacterium]|nr:SPFH domain-containing protein [Polyangiaceae bacterium]
MVILTLVVLAAVVLACFVFYALIKRLLYVATPNEVLIFCGSTRLAGNKRVGYRFVRGGRSLRVPFLERVERLDLNMFTVMVNVEQAFTKGGIPLDVQGVANVKLPGDEPLLANAVERFLGRSRDEVHRIAKETLEGNLRGVLAGLTPEEVNQDKQRFAEQLLEEAEHDMTRMGLVLDTLKIQNVSDKVKYLSSAGRMRAADLNQRQAAAEALARTDARVQEVQNWCGAEVAKIAADLEIARQETRKRVADASSRRTATIAESRGQVLAQIATVRADIERQLARAPQVRRQLDADVVEPALAQLRAAEESARGEAARIVERGRADAESLRQLLAAYTKGGTAARDVLVLQKLLPMLGQITGSARPLDIARMTVLPAGGAGGGPSSELARQAIGINEQLEAVTGVDLARLAREVAARLRLTPGQE